jgi:hypothetical protein
MVMTLLATTGVLFFLDYLTTRGASLAVDESSHNPCSNVMLCAQPYDKCMAYAQACDTGTVDGLHKNCCHPQANRVDSRLHCQPSVIIIT